MTADPYARLDAVYLLAALDADGRLGADGATYDLGSCVRGWTRRAW
jgi:hypothetical protein